MYVIYKSISIKSTLTKEQIKHILINKQSASEQLNRSRSREINDHFTKSSTEQVFYTDLFIYISSKFNPMTGLFTAHIKTARETWY